MSPFYGALVNAKYGFQVTCDIVAFMCLLFAILYLVLGGGVEALAKTCKKRTQLDDNYKKMSQFSRSSFDKKSMKSSNFHMNILCVNKSVVRSHERFS